MKLFFVLALVLGSLSFACLAGEQAVIGYIELPKVLDSKLKSSPYNRLMAKLLARIDLPYSTQFVSSGRANALMHQGRLDCIFPVVPGGYQRSVPTILSDTTNNVSVHLFSAKPPGFTSLKEMEDKVIVYSRGMYFGDLFRKNKNIKFLAVDSEDIAIKLLFKNRADAYLAYYPDIKLSLDKEQYRQLVFDAMQPVAVSEDKLECADNAKNKAFIDKFNKELDKMKASGELKLILGDYFNF